MVNARKKRVKRKDKIEIDFLEAVRKRVPGDWMVLEALGDLYTRIGRVEEGLEVDEELVHLRPHEAITWYNLGCSYALSGKTDKAFEALEKAVKLGYDDVEWLEKDEDLDPLRKDPRFRQIVSRLY